MPNESVTRNPIDTPTADDTPELMVIVLAPAALNPDGDAVMLANGRAALDVLSDVKAKLPVPPVTVTNVNDAVADTYILIVDNPLMTAAAFTVNTNVVVTLVEKPSVKVIVMVVEPAAIGAAIFTVRAAVVPANVMLADGNTVGTDEAPVKVNVPRFPPIVKAMLLMAAPMVVT